MANNDRRCPSRGGDRQVTGDNNIILKFTRHNNVTKNSFSVDTVVPTVLHSNIDNKYTHSLLVLCRHSFVQSENVEGECKEFQMYKLNIR